MTAIVYVTGRNTNTAFQITPGGEVTEIIDAAGDGAGNPLTAPGYAAVDGAGLVYVTGRFTDNAFKISPGGAISSSVAWLDMVRA